jgi:hypothetical protein
MILNDEQQGRGEKIEADGADNDGRPQESDRLSQFGKKGDKVCV